MQKVLLCLLFLFFSFNVTAQQWLWGKRAGGQGINSAGANDMVLDKWGNLYIAGLAEKSSSPFDVDGNPVSFYTLTDNSDILITSFSCDGTYRWSKVIDGGNEESIWAIGVDKLGGVYVSGNTNGSFAPGYSPILHIGADTEPSDSSQSIFIVKLDTAGNYQWLRRPQQPTPGVYAYAISEAMDMDVDSAGNVRVLCKLPIGNYGGAYAATDSGIHLLRYDAGGNFISGFRFDITLTSHLYPRLHMRRDHGTDRYYLNGTKTSGSPDMSFGGNLIESNMFLGAFNSQGQHLWTKKGTNYYASPYGLESRASLDDSGFIYIAGTSTHLDTFGNHVVFNSIVPSGSTALAFAARLDSTGNVQWLKNASCTTPPGTRCWAGAMSGNYNFTTIGIYSRDMLWPGYAGITPNLPSSSNPMNLNVFITSFNRHTGEIVSLDTLGSTNPSTDWGTAIAADKDGQVYIGGSYENDLQLGYVDTLSPGEMGSNDLFIVKYGVDNCITSSAGRYDGNAASPYNIYPNPAEDFLYIEAANTSFYSLYSVTGERVQEGAVRPGINTINIAPLASGIYLLQIGKSEVMKKVVKR